MQCSLKQCTEDSSLEEDGRVEVCTVLPSGGYMKLSNKCLVKWNHQGEGLFHHACWEQLLKSARAKKSKKHVIKCLDQERKMILEAAKTVEKHDGKPVIINKAKKISDLLKSAKHCIAFTGAGISTSAGLGDYRGKSGKWTEEDRSNVVIEGAVDECPTPSKRFRRSSSVDSAADAGEEVEEDGVKYELLRPTYTHEALHKLVEMDIVKHVISQNGDGLHTLSGIPVGKISELHGNVFIEKCETCGERYDRPQYVLDDTLSQYYEELEDYGKTSIRKPQHAKRCLLCKLSHRTGRRCEHKGCRGYLMDTIINFGDDLEEAILDRAIENARTSDLVLCLGTTLTVTPANELVEMGQQPLQLVICNRQTTHCDSHCGRKHPRTKEILGSRVFGDCDVLMKEVMKFMMSAAELQQWQESRPSRITQYDKQRTSAN